MEERDFRTLTEDRDENMFFDPTPIQGERKTVVVSMNEYLYPCMVGIILFI